MLALLCVLTEPGTLQAAISVTLFLDRNEATINDVVRLSVSMQGKDGSEPPHIAGLKEFIVNPGGKSTQIQIINGEKSEAVEYSYYIKPRKTGVFTIGPASVSIAGRSYSSDTIRLTISQQPASTSAGGKGILFLTAELSSKEAYLEQQLVYNLKLYHMNKISDVSVTLPKTNGITLRPIDEPKEYMSTLGGQSYQVLYVRYLLLPEKPGAFSLEPAHMGMTVYEQKKQPSRDFFDDPGFGFTQGRPMTIASEPVALNVRPLPQTGRPRGFTGLVGNFQLAAKLTPSQIKTGDSASLAIQITGAGNVNRIPDISLPEIPGIKIYPDQPKMETSIGVHGLNGTKTMKWALVPQNPGTYQIPALTFSYFAPETETYKTLRTASQILKVLPGEQQHLQVAPSTTATSGVPVRLKREVEELGKDILPVHTSMKDLQHGLNIRQHLVFTFIILLLPVIIYLVVAIILRLKRKNVELAHSIRSKKAAKAFAAVYGKKSLSASETMESLQTFINDRFGLAMGIITPDEMRDILTEHKVSRELVERFHGLYASLQQAVYTGRGDQPVPFDEDLERLIRQIDREAA